VLITLPREVVMASRLQAPVDAVARAGVSTPTEPDGDALACLADELARADCPYLVTGASGRDPRTVEPLAELAELAGAWITDSEWRERLNVPSRHPMLDTGPPLRDADLVIAVERAVPWVSGSPAAPNDEATIAWLAQDPIASDIPAHGFRGDLRIACDPYAGITALLEAVRTRQSAAARARAQARFQRGVARRLELDRELGAHAEAVTTRRPIEPRLVASELGALLDDEAILLDESVSSAPLLRAYHRGSRPGSFYAQSGSAGGWGSGAALGAKLAAPDRDVVLVSGDGFYGFGVPAAALWTAARQGAPYVSVVLVNGRYSTGTRSADAAYPDGWTARGGSLGGVFEPPPDFAAEARAAGAFGLRVDDPAELRGALQRGLEAGRAGSPAVVAVVVA
jgi:acetolactate synthase-1/2/3 large subunit